MKDLRPLRVSSTWESQIASEDSLIHPEGQEIAPLAVPPSSASYPQLGPSVMSPESDVNPTHSFATFKKQKFKATNDNRDIPRLKQYVLELSLWPPLTFCALNQSSFIWPFVSGARLASYSPFLADSISCTKCQVIEDTTQEWYCKTMRGSTYRSNPWSSSNWTTYAPGISPSTF